MCCTLIGVLPTFIHSDGNNCPREEMNEEKTFSIDHVFPTRVKKPHRALD
jgi:hypothetical protein